MQGQARRDRAEEFSRRNATILGASFDAPAENRAFVEAQQCPFDLLSDEDRSVGTGYEVVRQAGEPYVDFPRRISYLIDPVGTIRHAYDVADVAGHADQVLADIDRLAP